jgi:hypothetical protein
MESEPFCSHVPARYQRMVDAGEAEPVDDYFARRGMPQGRPPTLPLAPVDL